MQKQTINKIIRKKIDEWIESINDTELRHDLKKHVLVTGGSIASMLLQEQVNDYDVYLMDRPTLLKLVNYYVDMVDKSRSEVDVFDETNMKYITDKYPGALEKSTGQLGVAIRNLKPGQIRIYTPDGGFPVSYETTEGELKKYRPLFISPNAISLSDDLQIVNRFYGDPAEIHKTFDFIHATNYWTYASGVQTNLSALESLLSKRLVYQGSHYPVTSIIRVRKFLNRHWNISAGELLKIMFQISQLDLKNIAVLEEQLIGVDVAYFSALIRALSKVYEDNPDFDLTPPYLNEMIDRIFNKTEEDD